MPRYCDACRTFITSRDSLTRNATPAIGCTPERNSHCPHSPHNSVRSRSASRVCVIPFGNDCGQAFNACSCPKNRGNLREFWGYCGHCTLYVDRVLEIYPTNCAFRSNGVLSKSTVIVCHHGSSLYAARRRVPRGARGLRRGCYTSPLRPHPTRVRK